MKKTILIFILFISLFSCENKEKDLKIKKLQEELDYSKREILALKKIDIENSRNSARKINDLNNKQKNLEQSSVLASSISYFLKDELQFIINDKIFFKFLFESFHIEKYEIVRGISNNGSFTNFDVETENILSKYDACRYITSNMNRRPENLKKILTPSLKEFIFSLLKHNNIYKKSGTYSIVKALLASYNEVSDFDLKQLYKKGTDGYTEAIELINDIHSEEVKNILVNPEFTQYENWSSTEHKLHIVYSFWARRHHERNKEYTYNFLLELHLELTGEDLS